MAKLTKKIKAQADKVDATSSTPSTKPSGS